ncbi:PilZ domain-containing protein [Thalassotalea sp. M1531]|uniref:PilZ domain-containing protein n=1 Tax=Thalassotalea algicola TaxID=2716224 RepID=A0A7Y0LCT6_9GAMM|nr:PilZ domain-containing protein [Thalassotalea algicola]NMP31957.1 PilZ domain-containing protein [Thalassotalea algicola]
MTKDFSQYSSIIERFRGQVNQSEFEANFTHATKSIAKTERFLLKMEIKRLAQPCTRLIDLRGHVDGECKAYEHDKRTHFLDDIAIKVYQDNVSAYGSYTFGVYEAVNNTENNFRVIYQREKSGDLAPAITKQNKPKVFEKLQYPAKFYQFGNYADRKEERMNFAIPILITLTNDITIEATSSDISVHGCRFKFNEPQKIAVDDVIQIEFTGLTQDFQFGQQSIFEYQVKNLEHEDNIQFIGVQRLLDKPKDGFKQFLAGYIQGNKRRYKINLDNTIAALQARSLEQFTLPKSNELPIFMEASAGEYAPRYALTSNNNQSTYQYWQDELKHNTLHCLVSSSRVERLLRAAKLGRSLTVYSFIHQSKGKSYFYTADEKQLSQDKGFMNQFIGFAASKPSFAVTLLTILSLDKAKAYSPLTLANTLPKKDEYLNLPPSEDIEQRLSRTPYVVVALDITDEQIRQEYAQLSFEDIQTSKLKSFGHIRLTSPPVVDELGINYRNQRIEPRFVYKTPVEVEADGVNWIGKSQDFSVSGLKVHLEKSAVLTKGEIVNVSFPNLQKITSSFELKSLPYEVMRINKKKNILNLRVHVEKHQHIGRAFFKVLIEKNKDKLTKDEYADMNPGLSKALRSIYAHTLNVPSLFIQTSGSRYKIESIGSSSNQLPLLNQMKALSDRPNHYNLYPLLNNQQAISLMSNTLKKLQSGDAPITDTLYISIKHESELIDSAVTTKLASELKTTKLRKMFIDKALNNGRFYCILVKLSRTDEPDMEHLNPELSYIGSYAIHRGKQIEQEIWSVAGVIQCFDITQEVILRHQLLLQ